MTHAVVFSRRRFVSPPHVPLLLFLSSFPSSPFAAVSFAFVFVFSATRIYFRISAFLFPRQLCRGPKISAFDLCAAMTVPFRNHLVICFYYPLQHTSLRSVSRFIPPYLVPVLINFVSLATSLYLSLVPLFGTPFFSRRVRYYVYCVTCRRNIITQTPEAGSQLKGDSFSSVKLQSCKSTSM